MDEGMDVVIAGDARARRARERLEGDAALHRTLGSAVGLGGLGIALALAWIGASGGMGRAWWSWGDYLVQLAWCGAGLVVVAATGAITGCQRASAIAASVEDTGYMDRGLQVMARGTIVAAAAALVAFDSGRHWTHAAPQLLVGAAFLAPRWLAIASLTGRLAAELDEALGARGAGGKVVRSHGIRATPTRALAAS